LTREWRERRERRERKKRGGVSHPLAQHVLLIPGGPLLLCHLALDLRRTLLFLQTPPQRHREGVARVLLRDRNAHTLPEPSLQTQWKKCTLTSCALGGKRKK